MRKSNLPPQINADERFQKAESDLYFARQTILELMPSPFDAILESYLSCQSRADSRAWEAKVADEVIQNAQVLTREEGSYWEERAYCPLCRGSSSAPYDVGFSLPEGLRRHLVGWGGRTHQCRVMVAVMGLARNYWNERFLAQEEAEKALQFASRSIRLQTETLYLTTPNAAPQLLDTGRFFRPARSAESLAWAESRLEELGFRIQIEKNVKAYIDDRDKLVIYADPTTGSRIEFRAFKKPLPKRGTPTPLDTYEIPDRWKHDLKAKYENWLLAVLSLTS